MTEAQALRIVAIRQYTMRLIEDLGGLPGAAASFRGQIGGQTIVEIESSDGARGIAPGVDAETLALAREHLVGRPLFPIAGNVRLLIHLLKQMDGALGRNGASIEIALWDAAARSFGLPLYRLWGGEKARILGYGSTIGRGASIEERVEVSIRLVEEGWKAIKLRPHWETVAEDVRLIEEVRKATPSDLIILCDANQARGKNLAGVSWDLERAVRTADAFHALGVGWLEEPLARHAYDDLAALARRSKVPLAGGENNVALDDFRNYALHQCYAYWQPEVMLVGPSRMLALAAVAETFGIRLVPHEGYQSLGTICQIHLAAAVGAPFVEILHNPPISTYANYTTCYAHVPCLAADGHIELNDKAGLGVELRRELIEFEH
jgi:L-alanine-DL-glutamate epimerase-like enolase superfamily enzyme